MQVTLAAMRSLLAEAVRLHFRTGRKGTGDLSAIGHAAFEAALEPVGLSDRVLAFADQAYALPVLASACRRAGVRVTEPAVAEALHAAYYLCAARAAALRVTLEEVGAALAAGDVPFLVLKGGALELLAPWGGGAAAGGEARSAPPPVRVTADLDVLVPRGQMARAETLLLAAGFRPRYAAHVEEFRRHSHHAVPYINGSGLAAVEIHETLEPRGAIVRLPVEPLWERSLAVLRGDREWRVPDLSDLALHTCVHYGIIHPYNTALRRLWDLGVLSTFAADGIGASRFRGIDWEWIERETKVVGGRRVVRQARAELAWLLDDAPEPRWPLFDAPYSGAAAFRLQQAAADTLWDRARGAWHFLFPGPHETAPVRAGNSHAQYLVARFSRALGSRDSDLGEDRG